MTATTWATNYDAPTRDEDPQPTYVDTADMHPAREVCALARISARQLDYWCQLGIVEPVQCTSDGRVATGSGTSRWFTTTDTAHVSSVAELVDYGFTPDAAARYSHGARLRMVTALREVVG